MADSSWQESRRRRMRFRLAAVVIAVSVASLFTAGWMINQAVIGSADHNGASKESMAQELAQSPGNQSATAPSTENKDANSFAAYGSPKDPFNPVLKKKSEGTQPQAGGTNGTGGAGRGAGSTGTGTGTGAAGRGQGSRSGGPPIITNPPTTTVPGGSRGPSSGAGSPTGGRGSRVGPGGPPSANTIPGGVRKRGGDRFNNGRGVGQGTGRGTNGRGNGAGAGKGLPNTGGVLPNTGGQLPDTGGQLPDTGGEVLPPGAPPPIVYN